MSPSAKRGEAHVEGEKEDIDVYSLDDLRGVGEATKEKLASIGIYGLLDLAAASPRELVDAGIDARKAEELCLQARVLLVSSGFLDSELMTGKEVLERRKSLERITTGCSSLDNLLRGGVETQAVTELVGEYGCGKTQLCHTLCVTAQLPKEKGGLSAGAIYIDTESTFRPERVYEIAKARGLNPEKILEGVVVSEVYNSSHLQLVVRELGRHIEKYKARLVIVDSIISHFRADYVGRENLSERQQKLNAALHRLLRLAEIRNVAVVVTNQVIGDPGAFYGNPIKPSGGHVLAHGTTYRVFLRRGPEDTRVARIMDSPYHPSDVEARFKISEKGIEDAEPSKR
ncbi:MAG: DNA repair and recombination protein RadA [Nitrososphaerota archaeon]